MPSTTSTAAASVPKEEKEEASQNSAAASHSSSPHVEANAPQQQLDRGADAAVAGEASSTAVAAAAATGTIEPAPRRMRLLKDVEADENRYIYETLYKSLDDETDKSIRDELTVGDTVRQARVAKKEFLTATSLPMKEKMKGCATLMRSLSEEQNKKVAYVFVVYSVLILTLPLVMLMLGLHVLAPLWGVDPTYCGGGLAVTTALVLVVSYVTHAVREDIADFKRKAEQEAEAKKKK
ncbi:hypothetical protein NQL31_000293 [Lotmaria passim]